MYYSYRVGFQREPYKPGPSVAVIEDLMTSADFIHSDTLWLRRTLILWQEIIKVTALKTKDQRENSLSSIIRKKSRIRTSNFREVLRTKRGN